MTTATNNCIKYSYWVENQALQKLKSKMEVQGVEMAQAQQIPCEALRGRIGYAAPQVWDSICRYDAGPWYKTSTHAGKYLVVSSFPLDNEYINFFETTIELTAFEPPSMPSAEDRAALAHDAGYLSREPHGWGKFPPEMGEAIVNGLAKLSGTPAAKFPDLLQTWTAVHANFVNPRYRTGAEFNNAPYSIADTVHISSCCVELFNLLESKEPAMLVRPCIGSVILKVLERDCYYLV